MTNRDKVEKYLRDKGHTKNGSVSQRIFEMLDAGLLMYTEEKEPEFSLDWPHGWIETSSGRDATLMDSNFIVDGVPHLVWKVEAAKEGRVSDVLVYTYENGTVYANASPRIINKLAPITEHKGYVFPNSLGYTFSISRPRRSASDIKAAILTIHGATKDA